jgi:hypothetical protein
LNIEEGDGSMRRLYALVIASLATVALVSAPAVAGAGTAGRLSAAIATRTAMSLSAAKVTYGREQDERVSVTVSASRTPTGKVTVKAGSATVCVITLAKGKGACSITATKFAPGRVKLSAAYGGSGRFARSISPAKTFNVAEATSKTTLTLSAAKVTYGDEQSERLSVRVSPQYSGTPGGKVKVNAGSSGVCAITLKSGTGSCSLSASEFGAGADRLTAVYTGNPDFRGSVSATATLTVVTVSTCSHTAAPFCFPTSVSSNGRYLLDQDGNPYMIVGDSPQSLIVNLTEAEANDYFADREAHGFNAAWLQILCNNYTGGQDSGNTYDGIPPFTTQGDFATPNPAYFDRVADMLTLAENHGITAFLDPADTGGWLGDIESNGQTADFNYGVYLGDRFKNFPNIVWLNGNDFQSWMNSTDDADVSAIAEGIASVDPSQLQTVELNYDASSSLDDATWAPIIKLNLAYTYFPTYAEVLHAYNQSPTIPVFMGEANYEFENNTGADPSSPYVLRLQEYWTMTSGATGQLYGNHYTWDDGTDWTDEEAHLDTVGVQQLQYMEALFDSLPWQNLVPDQSHKFVTAGYGTFSTTGALEANNYVTAAIDPSGTTGVAYLPQQSTITVNMAAMSGTVTAKWYDPTTGVYTTIGTFANTGSKQFSSPGTHSDGTDDWVLLLQS